MMLFNDVIFQCHVYLCAVTKKTSFCICNIDRVSYVLCRTKNTMVEAKER